MLARARLTPHGPKLGLNSMERMGSQAIILDLGLPAQILSPGTLCKLLSEHGNLFCA